MKKNVFSRTLAVLASMTVLGAASMISASAEGESLSVSNATGTPGETVTVQVSVACNNNFESLDTVLTWEDTALTASMAVPSAGVSGASDAGDGYVTVVAYGSAAIADGAIASIDFTIPEDAEVGTQYAINVEQVNTFAIFDGADIADTVPATGGVIEVVAPATEPEPSEEPSEAPSESEAPAETTVADTTKAASTGSPKTGSAGVAVAVAGLVTAGATAVVLKKRH
jgi:LPXTG-motif cell wall-anchored protein